MSGHQAASATERLDEALLERETELAEIERLARLATEGRGSLLVIEGEAGIGKTRLLTAARELAGPLGMRILAGRCSELEIGFAFGVVRQLFEAPVAAAAPTERDELLGGAARLADAVLTQAPDEPEQPNPSFSSLHGLYWLTYNLSRRVPLALLVDDVQWADPASLRFLGFLRMRLPELPVLLVLTRRSGEADGDAQELDSLCAEPLARRLRLRPLGELATTELVCATLSQEAAPEFAHECRKLTGGNPFLLRALLSELATEGVTPSAEELKRLSELSPTAVSRSLFVQLGRMPEAARRLSTGVAVLGDRVPLRHAVALSGLGEAEARGAAEVLTRAGIFARSTRTLDFAHPLFLSAIYQDLPPAVRAREHERAAALLMEEGAPAERVAAHLLKTEAGGNAARVRILRDAGLAAHARGAPDAAAAYLRRALEEPPEAAVRGSVLLSLGRAERDAGDPATVEHLREAADALENPRDAAFAVMHLIPSLLMLPGHTSEALELLDLVRERLGSLGTLSDDDQDVVRLLEAEFVAAAQLDLALATGAKDRLKGLPEPERPTSRGECALLGVRAFQETLQGGSAERAGELAERSLSAPGPVVERYLNTPPYYRAIPALVCADRLEVAERSLDLALQDARAEGSALAFVVASMLRSHVAFLAGRVGDAEAEARAALDASETLGWMPLPYVYGCLAEALLERGRAEEAEAVLASSGHADFPDHMHFIGSMYVQGRVSLARQRVADGSEELLEAVRRMNRWGRPGGLYLSPASLVAPVLAGRGERAEADRLLDEEETVARGWGTPRAIGRVLRARGLVEGGEQGIELLEAAVAELERSPGRLELAGALVDLGAALRRANRRVESREPLERGHDLARECHAAALEERARQELAAAGARPRRVQRTGLDELTPSERRVARMAAEGLSNPEIAQALFVTTKTVETHLGRVYRKLDISSRHELPAELTRGE